MGPAKTCVVAKLLNTPGNIAEARKAADAAGEIVCLTLK